MKLKTVLISVALASATVPAVALVPSDWAMGEPVASARTKNEAEALRLQDEMSRLAGRNAWKGVDSTYRKLVALKKITVPGDYHFLGAQAPRSWGDIATVVARFKAGIAAGHKESQNDYDALTREFGNVVIKKRPKGDRSLEKVGGLPFAPDQRGAIEWAGAELDKEGGFSGWLPLGDYTVGGQAFTVTAGEETLVKRK